MLSRPDRHAFERIANGKQLAGSPSLAKRVHKLDDGQSLIAHSLLTASDYTAKGVRVSLLVGLRPRPTRERRGR